MVQSISLTYLALLALTLDAGHAQNLTLAAQVSIPTVPPGAVTQIQLSLVTPHSISSGAVSLDLDPAVFDNITATVQYNGARTLMGAVPISPAVPGLFTIDGTGQGRAVALNDDNTVNDPSNPAARGTVIQIYGTGEASKRKRTPASAERHHRRHRRASSTLGFNIRPAPINCVNTADRNARSGRADSTKNGRRDQPGRSDHCRKVRKR